MRIFQFNGGNDVGQNYRFSFIKIDQDVITYIGPAGVVPRGGNNLANRIPQQPQYYVTFRLTMME